MSERKTESWVVFNQSIWPYFLKMMDRLSASLGACVLYASGDWESLSERVRLKRLPVYRRGSLWQRAFSWLMGAIAAVPSLLACRSDQYVLLVSNPPILPHVGWLCSKLKGFRYGVLVYDIYPDHLVRAGTLREGSAMVRLWHGFNARVFKDAACVVTLGERMADALKRHTDSELLIDCIPVGADVEAFQPIEKSKNPFVQQQHLMGKTHVLYSGNMGISHAFDGLVQAMRAMADVPDVVFMFIGQGAGADMLQAMHEADPIAHVRLLPFQPWETVPYSLASGDIAIVSQQKGTADLSIPNKTFAFMAAGCAILALTDEGSDLASLVKTHAVGRVVDVDDPKAIERCLREMLSDGQALEQYQRNARQAAVEHFSLERVCEQWEQVLRRSMQAQ